MSEEIGAEGDENRRATIRVPGGFDERVDERTPLLLGNRRREHFFELIHRDDQAFPMRHATQGLRKTTRECLFELRGRPLTGPEHRPLPLIDSREETRAQQRRLAASGWADDREQRRAREAGDELVDQSLASEEELRVGGFERRQPLVRTDQPLDHGRGPRPRLCLGVQLLVLSEYGPLELS